MTTPLENSLKSRIRTIAKSQRIDPAQLWRNLVLERFLVRLSRSDYRSHFILKGGVLLAHYVKLDRHTQDLDFLIQRLSHEVKTLKKVFSSVISIPLEDGFHFTNLEVYHLPHPHMKYAGVRANMLVRFGKARFLIHVDLGFGDVVIPTELAIPLTRGDKGALFETKVNVACYPKEFIFAEKLETIIYRGAHNSRMKDFHDLNVMIKSKVLNGQDTEKIVKWVFKHRQTEKRFPIVFSRSELRELQKFWQAHLRGLPQNHAMPLQLKEVILEVNAWMERYTSLCHIF